MKAMTPLALDEIQNNSSSTESAHDHVDRDGASGRTTSKYRPSKIPLAGTKGYFAPKPPTGRNSIGSRSQSGPPSNKSLNKSTSSLNNRFDVAGSLSRSSNTTLTNNSRPDSALSIRKDVSINNNSVRNTSSIPVSTQKTSPARTITTTTASSAKSSPIPKTKRESFSSKIRHMDSLSRLYASPTHSSISTSTTTTTHSSPINLSPTHVPSHETNNSPYKLRDKKQLHQQNAATTPVRRLTNASFGSKGIDLSTTEPVEKVQTNLRKIWNMLKI